MGALARLWVVLCLASPLAAQTASLRGAVTDESGAVAPGARVTLSGPGARKTAVADQSGAYTFTGIAPGDYTVMAAAPELGLPEPVAISLHAGSQTRDLVLRVAPLASRVSLRNDTVQRAPPALPAIRTSPG